MNPVVLPITAAHVPSFREALDAVAKERRYLSMVEAPKLEAVRAFVEGNIAKGIAQFVAVDDERVVGWADIVPGWTHGLAHRGTLGMGVLPEYRGQGLGRRLLEACIRKSWENGLSRIELEVRSDNLSAIALYTRLGFVRECLKAKGLRIDGEYFEMLQMVLLREKG